MPATKRKFAAPPGLLINSSTTVDSSVASTTPSTGAFVISGGVGIGDTLNVKGHINLWNDPNTFYTGLRSGTLTTSTYYILPSNFPGTGTSVLQSDTSGVLAWVPMTATSSGSGTTAINLNVVAAATNATHYILFSPTNGGSGVAVSSDAGLFFNPGSNTLTTTTFAAGSAVNTVSASVSGSTASTSSTSGSLVVTGGVGIGQSVSIGGRLQLFNGSNYTAFVSSASGNTVYTLPATSPATGTSVLQSDVAGVMSWVPMTATSSGTGTTAANINVVLAGTSASHPLLFPPTVQVYATLPCPPTYNALSERVFI